MVLASCYIKKRKNTNERERIVHFDLTWNGWPHFSLQFNKIDVADYFLILWFYNGTWTSYNQQQATAVVLRLSLISYLIWNPIDIHTYWWVKSIKNSQMLAHFKMNVCVCAQLAFGFQKQLSNTVLLGRAPSESEFETCTAKHLQKWDWHKSLNIWHKTWLITVTLQFV